MRFESSRGIQFAAANHPHQIEIGADDIYGGTGADTAYGGFGDDEIFGESQDDLLFGEEGNDRIDGGYGNDEIDGGSGDDFLVGGFGQDLVFGFTGYDVLYGGNGNDDLYGGSEGDYLFGEADNDGLFGEGGADFLSGGLGDDDLFGGFGNDRLVGGAGDDLIVGGDGSDLLTGNAGSDIFYWEFVPLAGDVDTIVDFTSGVDWLDFEASSFGFASGGLLPTSAFRLGTSAQDADDRFIYDETSGDLFFDADGTGSEDQVLVANLGAGTKLTVDDFYIFDSAAEEPLKDIDAMQAAMAAAEMQIA